MWDDSAKWYLNLNTNTNNNSTNTDLELYAKTLFDLGEHVRAAAILSKSDGEVARDVATGGRRRRQRGGGGY